MLKAEVLKANEPLQDLTDEQVKYIVALSKMDEENVIRDKVREIHDAYDKDIKELTGVDRESTEKTYNYLKRAVGEKIKGLDEYQSKIDQLEKDKAELLKKGEGKQVEELKKQLDEKIGKIEALKDKHAQALQEKEAEIEKHMSGLEEFKVSSMFSSSISGLKFNDTYPEEIRKTMISSAEQYVKGLDREWIDGQLRFKTKEGEILRDKKTLEPLTVEAIAKSRLQPIMAEDRKAGGAGGKTPKGGAPTITGAKNKSELVDLARKQAMSEGLSPSDLTGKFQSRVNDLYSEGVTALEG